MNGQHLSGSGLNNVSSNKSSSNSTNNEQFNLVPRSGQTNLAFVAEEDLPKVNGKSSENLQVDRTNGWPRPNSSDNFGTILGFLESNQSNHNSMLDYQSSANNNNQLLLVNVSRLDQRNFYTDIRAEMDEKHLLSRITIQFNVTHANYREILRSLVDEVRIWIGFFQFILTSDPILNFKLFSFFS